MRLKKNILILVEFLSYNLMLNSGKQFRALHDKKYEYSNSCVVRKLFSGRNKNHTPPPTCKLNNRSLIVILYFRIKSNVPCLRTSSCTVAHVLFTLFVCLCIVLSNTHCVVFLVFVVFVLRLEDCPF